MPGSKDGLSQEKNMGVVEAEPTILALYEFANAFPKAKNVVLANESTWTCTSTGNIPERQKKTAMDILRSRRSPGR